MAWRGCDAAETRGTCRKKDSNGETKSSSSALCDLNGVDVHLHARGIGGTVVDWPCARACAFACWRGPVSGRCGGGWMHGGMGAAVRSWDRDGMPVASRLKNSVDVSLATKTGDGSKGRWPRGVLLRVTTQ